MGAFSCSGVRCAKCGGNVELGPLGGLGAAAACGACGAALAFCARNRCCAAARTACN